MPIRRWASGMLAVVLLAIGLGGFVFVRRSSHTNRLGLARTTAASGAQTIQAIVHGDQAQLAAVGAVLAGNVVLAPATVRASLRPLTADAAVTAGLAVPESGGRVLLHPVLGPLADTGVLDLTTHPEWGVALALARDEGSARTVAAAGPGIRPLVLDALPLFAPGAEHDSVDSRRRSLVGYVATLEDPDAVALASLEGGAAAVGAELVQGSTVLAAAPGGGRRPLSAAAVVVPLADPELDWSVATWPRRTKSLLPWEFIGGGIVLAGFATALAAAGRRASRQAAAVADARARELQLVARMGPLLQRSLDVGDVLPLFAVELDEQLHLDGIAVSRIGPTGEFVRTFSYGQAVSVPRWPAELEAAPATVAPGGTIHLVLQRGGRAIGVVTARARDGLEVAQVQALRAVTDLLSAALGNARLFEQEQELVGRLRELDRMKTTFLGSVTHELRTTVTAVKGFAELLAVGGHELGDAERSDFVARIQRNATSLLALVDDLLDFARLDRQTLSISPQPVNLSELVPTVTDQMSSILGDHPLTLSITPNVVAVADPSAVERIVVNLLSNAAKYTPHGTPVEVAVERVPTRAVVTVTDRGPGIPVSERERIFQRFYRIDDPISRSTRGVGIGLALVLELVNLLDGTVTVDDAPGGGSRFIVEFPLAADETGPRARPQLLSS